MSRAASTRWTATGPRRRWSSGGAWATRTSGLRAARNRVGDPGGARLRIGILDTGFDPGHSTAPLHVATRLQRNFVERDRPHDATDPGVHFPGAQPGHGTGTIGLLAGNRVKPPLVPGGFDDFLGGAPFAEVVPIRIASSVIHFYTSAMAVGLDYAVDVGCHVVSISMGGVPSLAWARPWNGTTTGMTIVAAAGNNTQGARRLPDRRPRVPGALPPGDRGLRGHLRQDPVLPARPPRHDGQLRPAREDGDGDRRVHAQHALGGDGVRRGDQPERRRHVVRDAPGRGGGDPLAAAPGARSHAGAVAASRSSAARPLRERRMRSSRSSSARASSGRARRSTSPRSSTSRRRRKTR